MPLSGIPLKGAHNVENVLAAVVAARLAGVSAEAIRRAVEDFQAVEHRLEFVATRNGVEFYNDSKATNVDATAKAIAAFSGGIHLILGGKDKNSDYTLLSDLLRERVSAVYTIGAAAAKIESHLRGVVSHPLLRRRWTRPSVPPLPPRVPARWCCWRRPAPASTSSKAMSTAGGSSSNSS